MHSRWSHIKSDALRMRKRGSSIGNIESRLGIPRSTLSGWFRYIKLSKYHRHRLNIRRKRGLILARKEAVKWHHARKKERMANAVLEGKKTIDTLDVENPEIIELALAMLYMGEGSKKNSQTAMGNSDPLVLTFFVQAIQKLYGLSPSDFSCHLHLRADQDPKKLTRYWATTLGIPIRNFGKSLVDKRTAGSPTYPHYKGVCTVNCFRVAIQRKLMYIAATFCATIAQRKGG